MSCTKNPKKFLWFKYHGNHKYEVSEIKRRGAYSWAQYCVNLQCKLCSCYGGYRVMTESELISAGYDVNKLHRLSSFDVLATDAKKLK